LKRISRVRILESKQSYIYILEPNKNLQYECTSLHRIDLYIHIVNSDVTISSIKF